MYQTTKLRLRFALLALALPVALFAQAVPPAAATAPTTAWKDLPETKALQVELTTEKTNVEVQAKQVAEANAVLPMLQQQRATLAAKVMDYEITITRLNQQLQEATAQLKAAQDKVAALEKEKATPPAAPVPPPPVKK